MLDPFTGTGTFMTRLLQSGLIAQKDLKEANNKLTSVSEVLDELLDHAEEDEDLREISRYQVLLNQLHVKINGEEQVDGE